MVLSIYVSPAPPCHFSRLVDCASGSFDCCDSISELRELTVNGIHLFCKAADIGISDLTAFIRKSLGGILGLDSLLLAVKLGSFFDCFHEYCLIIRRHATPCLIGHNNCLGSIDVIRNGNVLVKLIDRGSIQPTHRIIHTIDRTLLICDQRISKPHRNGINAQRGEKGLVNLVAHNSESKAAYIFNRVYGTGTIRNAAEADLPVTEALDANCLNVCSELLTYIAVKNGMLPMCW